MYVKCSYHKRRKQKRAGGNLKVMDQVMALVVISMAQVYT